MLSNITTTQIVLKRNELIGLEDARGLKLRLCNGYLWITQAKDPRDIVIGPSQSFDLDRPGLALVTAVTDAVLVIETGSRRRRGRLHWRRIIPPPLPAAA
jgi:hypothetical protein